MTERTLVAILAGREIGRIMQDRDGSLAFAYDRAWRSLAGAVPLSLSMPLSRPDHRHAVVDAFLWNLLPDDGQVIAAWSRAFHVSPLNAFGLLAHVGEDCAGAVQLARPERVAALQAEQQRDNAWIDDADVARRLRALRQDRGAWRLPGDHGQFSLAGAQRKTALLREGGRWGVPAGRTPTTHILKPPVPGFDGHVENEHLCMALARALGLPTAGTEVMRFEDETAIVVERFDRLVTATLAAEAAAAGDGVRAQSLAGLARTEPILRRHQEDLCQALGLHPRLKYQSDGGPSARHVATLLRAHSGKPDEDVATFLDALAFNWLIGGTDAHAKNFALLHDAGGKVRLAPLYDVGSALPYPSLDQHRLKLSMKVGGTYRLRDIGPRQWRKQAAELDLDPDATADRALALAAALPEQARIVCDGARKDGLSHPIVGRLEAALVERADWCRRVLQGKAA
ncbi:MAG: type II toxin-antitoxin system HipA family toxin [Alphaproteobacteria bacterium]|nr:type II toxin-antitoxin system HipA family toxin [Alphaproteobacteria bacterium]